MAWTDATKEQAVRQPGGAEEDSRLRKGNRHLHLAYEEEEEEEEEAGLQWSKTLETYMALGAEYFFKYIYHLLM